MTAPPDTPPAALRPPALGGGPAPARRCGLIVIACLATFLLVLAGCAAQAPVKAVDWSRHRSALEGLDRWRLEGKIGYRAPADNGSAWLNWHQDRDAYTLILSGPLGAGAARIQGDTNHAVLLRAGDDPLKASTATELTHWLLGMQLPVEQMRHWVKGVPAAAPPYGKMVVGPDGRLQRLEQSGWTLTYSDYRRHDEWTLPGKIRGTNGHVGFTLVISRWQPGPDREADAP